jgi:hypothetical protein
MHQSGKEGRVQQASNRLLQNEFRESLKMSSLQEEDFVPIWDSVMEQMKLNGKKSHR